VLFLSLCLLHPSAGNSRGRSPTRYPNELQGFKFYAKYLAPLRPGVSDREEVRRVLGDTAAVKRSGWTIFPTYTTKGGPVYDPGTRPFGGHHHEARWSH
jgi:hypothetical protein